MADLIRTFVAVLIPEDVRRAIGRAQNQFRSVAPEIRWVAEENFHISVKFLGDIDRLRVDAVADAIARGAQNIEPFQIEIGTAGAFPKVDRPRIVWVGVTTANALLAELAENVDKELGKIGLPEEEKPFRAHITIGRVKDNRGGGAIGSALRESEVGVMGTVNVDSIALMQSDLRRDGPIYSVIRRIPLKDGGGAGH